MNTNNNRVENSYKGIMSFVTRFLTLVAFLISFISGVQAQNQITMDMVWVGSTSTTADFDIILTNTGTSSMKFNGIVLRGNHDAGIMTAGGTLSWNALNNNALLGWNNGTNSWPNLTANLPYASATGLLNYSSNNVFFTNTTAPTLPLGTPINIGTFRATVTGGTWNPNDDFGFEWASTRAVIAYVNGAAVTTSINGASIVSTVSSAQPLNTTAVGPTASVLSGGGTICAGGSSNINVAITGGTSPYNVVYNDGTSNVTVSSYVSGTPISVSPTVSTTYSLVSVEDASSNAGTGNAGTALVTVNSLATGTDVQSACGSYTWPLNGLTYTASTNTVTHTIVGGAANGCDSIVTLNLTIPVIGIPMNVAATNVTGFSADITWDAMSLPVGGFFSIQYQIFPGGPWISGGTAPAGSTMASISGLTPGTLYAVQVAGNCDASNAGAWSADGFFTTTSVTCATPIAMSTTANLGNAITMGWTAVPGAAWYEFRYKATSSATWISGGTLGGSATSKTFSGLMAATSYDFQGRTFCPNGMASAWSATVTEVTGPLSGCGLAPVMMASTVSGTSATVTWSAVSGAAWYEFRYKPSASATWISGGSAGAMATSKSYSGLMMNTQYDFEGRTFCSNGIPSAWGAITFTTTALAGCELPPVLNMTAVATTSSITISWPAVAGAGWYSFQYKPSSSATWISGGTAGPAVTAKIFNGLMAGTSYDFQARTHCPNGIASAWSATGTYSTNPGAPSITTTTDKADSDVANKALAGSNHLTTVYPNPAVDKVNIEIYMDEASDNTTVKLMDMSGRLVREVSASTTSGVNTISMDVQDLTHGMYTVMVYQNGSLMHTSKVKKN